MDLYIFGDPSNNGKRPLLFEGNVDARSIDKPYELKRTFKNVEIQLPDDSANWTYNGWHVIFNNIEKKPYLIAGNWSNRTKITDMHPEVRLEYLWLTKRFFFNEEYAEDFSEAKASERKFPMVAGQKVIADVEIMVKKEKNRQETILNILIHEPSKNIKPEYRFSEGPARKGIPGSIVSGTKHFLFFEEIKAQPANYLPRKNQNKGRDNQGKKHWSVRQETNVQQGQKLQIVKKNS
jgi:hypothetical protein